LTFPQFLEQAPATARGHQSLVAEVMGPLVMPDSEIAEREFEGLAQNRDAARLIDGANGLVLGLLEQAQVEVTEDLLRSESFTNGMAAATVGYLNRQHGSASEYRGAVLLAARSANSPGSADTSSSTSSGGGDSTSAPTT